MSHPDPTHDRSNEYPEDASSHGKALNKKKAGYKERVRRGEVPKLHETVKYWAKHLQNVINKNK